MEYWLYWNSSVPWIFVFNICIAGSFAKPIFKKYLWHLSLFSLNVNFLYDFSPPFGVVTLFALFFSLSLLFSWYSEKRFLILQSRLPEIKKAIMNKIRNILKFSFHEMENVIMCRTWIILRMRAYSTSTPNTWIMQDTTFELIKWILPFMINKIHDQFLFQLSPYFQHWKEKVAFSKAEILLVGSLAYFHFDTK